MNYFKQIYRARNYYLFLLPALALMLVFGFFPPASALFHAFTDWDGNTANWVGLDNIEKLLQDTFLIKSVWNMLFLLVAGMITSNTMSMFGAALVFNMRSVKWSSFFRYMFILPMVVPGIVVMLVWKRLFDPLTGLLNMTLESLGLPHEFGWLGDPDMVLFALVFIGFPWVAGLGFLIYLSGFQNISEEVIEAASLEGAVGFRRFFRIDLPLLAGQIKFMLITGIIGGLQGFGIQLVLTQGGPGSSTNVPGWIMYQQAFFNSKFGYASMIGFALFIIIFLVTIINLKFFKSDAN